MQFCSVPPKPCANFKTAVTAILLSALLPPWASPVSISETSRSAPAGTYAIQAIPPAPVGAFKSPGVRIAVAFVLLLVAASEDLCAQNVQDLVRPAKKHQIINTWYADAQTVTSALRTHSLRLEKIHRILDSGLSKINVPLIGFSSPQNAAIREALLTTFYGIHGGLNADRELADYVAAQQKLRREIDSADRIWNNQPTSVPVPSDTRRFDLLKSQLTQQVANARQVLARAHVQLLNPKTRYVVGRSDDQEWEIFWLNETVEHTMARLNVWQLVDPENFVFEGDSYLLVFSRDNIEAITRKAIKKPGASVTPPENRILNLPWRPQGRPLFALQRTSA